MQGFWRVSRRAFASGERSEEARHASVLLDQEISLELVALCIDALLGLIGS